jgi:membrane protein YdbS with pleckstrin-like domain
MCRQCSVALPPGSAFCNRCGASQVDEPMSGTITLQAAGAPTPEQSLWKGGYALRAAMHLWILSALWMALVLALYQRFVGTRTQRLDEIALAVGLVPALLALARASVRRLSPRYKLTNHRLFTERGILGRQHDELELIRVDDISVNQNFMQRLFGVGAIKVLSSDSSTPVLTMEGIAHPLEFKELLRSQVRARRSRTAFLESL